MAGLAVAVLIPPDSTQREIPSVVAELRALMNARLWMTLLTCALISAGIQSVYSYISPLIIHAGMPVTVVPFALLVFGIGALIGSIVGGRLGDTRPLATTFTTAGISVIAYAGMWIRDGQPVPLIALFAVLGLVSMSANPILVSLAIRYGGAAPTLAGAMPTAIFNLGTAAGTGVTARALETSLGASAPPIVATLAGVLVFLPLTGLAVLQHCANRSGARNSSFELHSFEGKGV